MQLPEVKVSETGIYFGGDYLLRINNIISTAQSEIILIDGYLNEKILEMLGSKNPNVICKVLTLERSLTTLRIFIEAFNMQYHNLEVKLPRHFMIDSLLLTQRTFTISVHQLKMPERKVLCFLKSKRSL
jgi:hypothetical protein